MDDINKIKVKIGAIVELAKSEQKLGNEEAAMQYMAKAEAMMEKYQLEIWEVGDVGDPMGKDEAFRWQGATPGLNDHNLLKAVAVYYGCRLVTRSNKTINSRGKVVPVQMIDIIGRESARITVMLMFPFIMDQCKAEGKKLTDQGHGAAAKTTLRIINALVDRIYRMAHEAKRKEREASQQKAMESRALVIVEETEAFMKDAYKSLRMGPKARAVGTTEAARNAAAGISLHRQTTGASQLKLGSR